MKRIFLSLLAAAPLIGGCGSDPVLFPPAELQPLASERRVERLWSVQIGEGADGHFLALPPLVDGNRIFATDRHGRVIALAAETGGPMWRQELARPVTGAPGDGGETILLGGEAEVLALDKSDGHIVWQSPVSSEVLVSPVRSGDTVLVRTVDGHTIGLAAGDGSELWRIKDEVPLLSLRGIGAPVAQDSFFFLGFADGTVAAIERQGGNLLWRTVVALPRGRNELERVVDVDGQLVLRDGVLYATAYQGRVAALAAADGQVVWTRDLSSYNGVDVDGNQLFVADERDRVYALASRNGGTLWRQEALHDRKLSTPTVQGDTVVIGDVEGYLHWLSRDEGQVVARARVEKPFFDFAGGADPDVSVDAGEEERAILARPVVVGDRVYAIDQRGALNAFRVRD